MAKYIEANINKETEKKDQPTPEHLREMKARAKGCA